MFGSDFRMPICSVSPLFIEFGCTLACKDVSLAVLDYTIYLAGKSMRNLMIICKSQTCKDGIQ